MTKTRMLAAIALASLFSGAVHAVPISTTITLTPRGEGSVGYFAFDVTGAGLFDIFTTRESRVDPKLFLFENDGTPNLGRFITSDDDGCSGSTQCGNANWRDALLSGVFLDLGSYVAAVGDYDLTRSEARHGINDSRALGRRSGDVTVTVGANAGDTGTAMASARGAVPEPGSLALIAGGLLAGGFVGRRRRAVRADSAHPDRNEAARSVKLRAGHRSRRSACVDSPYRTVIGMRSAQASD